MKILPITQKKKLPAKKKFPMKFLISWRGGGLQRHVYVTITINISLFSFQILTFYRIRKWGRGCAASDTSIFSVNLGIIMFAARKKGGWPLPNPICA